MNEKQRSLVKNCEQQVEGLAKSPSFIMSLGAKELFHSNFLAFLLETREESLKDVQNNLKQLFGLEIEKKVYVWREKSNLDLVLVQIDIEDEASWQKCAPKVSIIENKLKSIPTKEQLVEYDEKIKKGMDFDLDVPICWNNNENIIELVKISKNQETNECLTTLVLMRKKLILQNLIFQEERDIKLKRKLRLKNLLFQCTDLQRWQTGHLSNGMK